jgi:hypothetical protein
MQTMLFLTLFMCVSLHIYAMILPQQRSCVPYNYTCSYPRMTLSNKIYGYSTGIAITPLYNSSNGTLAFNASCRSGSYLSITYRDNNAPGHEMAYIFKAQYATAYCGQIDCYNPAAFCIDFVNSDTCLFFDAVDCLGKSLVALRLLPLLHVALHSSSNAIKSWIFSHFPSIIPSQSSCFQLWSYLFINRYYLSLSPSDRRPSDNVAFVFWTIILYVDLSSKILLFISLNTRWVKLKIRFEPIRNSSQSLSSLLIDFFQFHT